MTLPELSDVLGVCPENSHPVPSRQIILALGNYMNSSKRGAVYGFKLQSLDLVSKPEVLRAVFFGENVFHRHGEWLLIVALGAA